MLCAAAYAAAATAIALGIAVALINVILVLSVLGGGRFSTSQQRRTACCHIVCRTSSRSRSAPWICQSRT